MLIDHFESPGLRQFWFSGPEADAEARAMADHFAGAILHQLLPEGLDGPPLWRVDVRVER